MIGRYGFWKGRMGRLGIAKSCIMKDDAAPILQSSKDLR